ncbi:mannose-specific lectin 3-like [Curcuma longa]|uniref:mannose-specific lectin 3-like n=1 Tax=Curcuma longa TaxID=136217 RepID=UPI003D9DDF62
MPAPAFLVVASAALFLLAALSSANEGNVLLTGDVLPTDGQLSYGRSAFVMQGDCNLVLYNFGRGFQSDTHGAGANCTLSLSNRGALIITSAGATVWSSPGSKKGKYAAVLRPDGEVAVYGPALWATPDSNVSTLSEDVASHEALAAVRNLLFSGQSISVGVELASRDYAFRVEADCNLVLNKAGTEVVWQSATAGRGAHCFARLDHRGQLAVVGDHYLKVVWSSNSTAGAGDYVLILQINGQAVVYGPVLWSTST